MSIPSAETKISAAPKAVAHIQKMIAKKGGGIGIRAAVKNSGCSGKSYVITLLDTSDITPEDTIYDLGENLTLAVDPESIEFLKGAVIDYIVNGLNSQLVFLNPNEKSQCGCGESFYV